MTNVVAAAQADELEAFAHGIRRGMLKVITFDFDAETEDATGTHDDFKSVRPTGILNVHIRVQKLTPQEEVARAYDVPPPMLGQPKENPDDLPPPPEATE